MPFTFQQCKSFRVTVTKNGVTESRLVIVPVAQRGTDRRKVSPLWSERK